MKNWEDGSPRYRHVFTDLRIWIHPVLWTLWPVFDGIFDQWREEKVINLGPLQIRWRYYKVPTDPPVAGIGVSQR